MIKFKLVLLKHKVDTNGLYPIYLRMTKDRKLKYINTAYRCKLNEWNENTCKLNHNCKDFKKANIILTEIVNQWTNKYNTLPINKREVISLSEFMDFVAKEKTRQKTLNFFELIQAKIDNLNDIGKIGNAKYYNDTRNSILRFTQTTKLTMENINVEWLKKYEKFLRMNKCVDSGIAVRMRAIRAIFNECIENNLIKLDAYPFKTYKISKLKQNKKIRAITIADIKKIAEIDPIKEEEKLIIEQSNIPKHQRLPKGYLRLAKDLFLFSYFTGGMNFKDMLVLKHSNIYNDSRITYVRSKTNRLQDFKLTAPAKEIVEYYKSQSIGTEYIFPLLLNDNMTPTQIANRRHKCLTQFNIALKRIGIICNIDFDITSYVARHSFASNLKDKGISTDAISEAMGHSDIKITQVYLKRLENEVIDNAMDKIADF